MRVLGIIPARGGSKGIPGKNTVSLLGKPLIGYTIEAANAATSLTRTIVSTDCEEIASVAREQGGDVPFLRPAELSDDSAPTLPVLVHALSALGEDYDAVMILQPTSPIRRVEDIDAVVALMEADANADSVISVVSVGDRHPARMKRIVDGCLVDPEFAEEKEGQRRQDLEPLFLRNGAIYLTRTSVLTGQHSIKGERSLAYEMPEELSVNIDHPIDLVVAEALMKRGEES